MSQIFIIVSDLPVNQLSRENLFSNFPEAEKVPLIPNGTGKNRYFLSHLAVYKMALEQHLSHFVVFEEDFVPHQFVIPSHLPVNFHALLFEGNITSANQTSLPGLVNRITTATDRRQPSAYLMSSQYLFEFSRFLLEENGSFFKFRPELTFSVNPKQGYRWIEMVLFNNGPYFHEFFENVYLNLPASFLSSHKIAFQTPTLYGENIVYNTEQLTRDIFLQQFKLLIEKTDKEIVDYSAENISLLKKIVPTSQHHRIHFLPLLYHRNHILEDIEEIEKKYDVGFIGTLTPRRLAILDKMKKAGLSVKVVNTFEGDEKIQMLAECHVVLNIHAGDDYRIFEYSRCLVPILHRMKVVSETSDVENETGLNKELLKYVTFSSYNRLVECIQRTLQQQKNKITLDDEKLQKLSVEHLDSFVHSFQR